MLIKILIALSLCVTFPTAKATEPLIPLASFIKEDTYAQPRLSPDGKYLAITVRLPLNDRFVPTIMVYSLPEMKEQSAVRMPVFEAPHEYFWVTNTRLLVTKAKEMGSQERPFATGEIFAMDFDGKNQEYLFGYNASSRDKAGKYGENRGAGEIVGFPAVRNGHFYMAAHMWNDRSSQLLDVDSRSASRKFITSLPIEEAHFVMRNDGTPGFAYGPDREGFIQTYQYDVPNDKWMQLDRTKVGGYLKPLSFTQDDKEIIALFQSKGEPNKLVRQNVATGERQVLVNELRGDIDLIQLGIDAKQPFAVATNVGIPQWNYVDTESPEAKLHKTLSGKFGGNIVNFINYTDDGNRLIFSVKSDREPGYYYLLDQKSNKAYPLFASQEAIVPEQMAERRPIQFTTRDGLKLDGYMTVPNGIDLKKKMPMIIMPHGGPHGPSDHWFFDRDAQFLASRGYAVLQVNFRGSGGKGVRFQNSGWKKWGAEIQNDLIDGVRWAINEANVDPQRICSYGASFGGYSALMLAVREPTMLKCAVGYIGVYDLNLMFTSDEARDPTFKAVMTRYLGQDKEQLDQFSPAKHADKIQVPVLLVHGMADKRATFNHAEAMRDALIKQGRPPEWMAVPDEAHGFYNTKNVTEFLQKLETFLAKHLAEK